MALFKLSGTTSLVTPPNMPNRRTWDPHQSANCWVQVASA